MTTFIADYIFGSRDRRSRPRPSVTRQLRDRLRDAVGRSHALDDDARSADPPHAPGGPAASGERAAPGRSSPLR
jgi:hypothetical protein